MPETKKQDIEWLDTLRALATIAVVMIHIATPVVKMAVGKNMEHWLVGNLYDSIVRFAVPIFLMLSGATMLGKEYDLSQFYKKRFMRVFFPLAFWIPVYVIFSWFTVKHPHVHKDFSYFLQWLWKLWEEKGISTHFWYLYLIFVLYIFVPFINILIEKISKKTILIILLVWLAINILTIWFPILAMPFVAKIISYLRYSGYLLLGYYLLLVQVEKPMLNIIGWILFFLSWLVTFFGTFILTMLNNKLNLQLYDYLGICSIAQAIGIFLFCKNSTIKNKYVRQVINTISNYSYGIYLVHIIIIGLLFINGIFWTMAHPAISVPSLVIITVLLSFAIIYVLRKIPGGKYISG